MTPPLPIRTSIIPIDSTPTPTQLVNAVRELEARIRAVQAQLISQAARIEALETP